MCVISWKYFHSNWFNTIWELNRFGGLSFLYFFNLVSLWCSHDVFNRLQSQSGQMNMNRLEKKSIFLAFLAPIKEHKAFHGTWWSCIIFLQAVIFWLFLKMIKSSHFIVCHYQNVFLMFSRSFSFYNPPPRCCLSFEWCSGESFWLHAGFLPYRRTCCLLKRVGA